MKDTCATVKSIKPIPGQLGAFEVQPPMGNLPNSFYVNFESQIGSTSEYLFFDGNKIAKLRLAAAPLAFTFGASQDPTAAAVGTELETLLGRMTGTTPMILKKMRITVNTQQLFEGTITVYTGSISGNVDTHVLDVNAAVNPGNNQGNVLDFYMPDNFVIDGFIGIGILLPATIAVQTYTATFEITGMASTYTMRSPCLDACEVM